MKILHVGNTAGVGSVIAKYMDRLFGTESLVVTTRASDPYGLTTYGEVWDCGPKVFTLKCLWLARKFDVVHVHYFDKIISFLRLLYPWKRVVMHYHGDDIRDKWSLKRKYWSKADAVLYSTPNLLDDETPAQAVYMPNPVDTGIFHSCSVKPKSKTAFHVSFNADDVAIKYAGEHGLELTIYNKQKHGVIPHSKLREVLCQYDYCIDVKRSGEKVGPALSKMGLEALGCGLKVIRWDGKVVSGLPPENHPEEVAGQVFAIYQSM